MWSLDIDYNDIKMTSLCLSDKFITDVETDITKLKNLTIVDMSVNRIREIPNEMMQLTKLTSLNLCLNYIKNIPKSLKNLENLSILILSYNSIRKFPSEVCHLINLKQLIMTKNKIKEISPEIRHCISLELLDVSKNMISVIPPEIQYLTNLKELSLSNNKIFLIPPEIKSLEKIIVLNIHNNLIKVIPSEIESLKKLKRLNISYNRINEIPHEFGNMPNLLEIYICYNNIISIPNSIINCKKLRVFSYKANVIQYVSPQVTRFLNRIVGLTKSKKLEVYSDKQNIHNHSIQECVKNSIMNITDLKIKIDQESIISDILSDSILTSRTKELLIEYSNDNDYHSVLLITFKELLTYIWKLIETNENKDTIKEILNTEILDSECKCFTGRLSRLVNCLNGFSPLVEIKISDTQQIANIIKIIENDLESKKQYTIEKHQELVKNELKLRGYSEKTINEWIEQIE